MEFINIYPVSHLEGYKEQPMNMFLTHLVERDLDYALMAWEHTGYKILDNSLIELGGVSVSFDRVLNAARFINASEIILPDKFRDGESTCKLSYEIVKKYSQEIYPYNIMAVAHGTTLEEVKQSVISLQENALVNVIGIPKVHRVDIPGGRASTIEIAQNYSNKPLHLLGLWETMGELDEIRSFKNIRSLDTSLPPLMDIKGITDISHCRTSEEVIDLEKDIMTSFYFSREAKRYAARTQY